MLNAKIIQICNITNSLLKYNQYLDFINNKSAINLEFQSVNKY